MKSLLFTVALLAGATTVHAQDAASTASAVRAADSAFEKRAQEVGAAQAFKDFMDEKDGLQFNGGPPTRGAEAIYEAMNTPTNANSRLEWTPLDAWGARSGDLGVTTGTWMLTIKGQSTPLVRGHYVTVWRKNASGQWRGLIDIGNPDPAPSPVSPGTAPHPAQP